jgi:ubiquinone/menaquinone biosynthesis C-methylase UbiE
MSKAFTLLAALLVLGRPAPILQEPPAKDAAEVALPPPLTEYMGRRIAPTMHWSGAEWLLRATREDEEHTTRMLAALGLHAGEVVCDFGCGVGYITLPMAKLVLPEGRILATDVQPEMLAALEKRAAEAGVTNVERILSELADPKLAPDSCDLVLMVDVYHELGYPEQVLRGVRSALKRDGRLVLVEFRAEDPEVPIKPVHKMTRAQVELELGANGFRLARAFEELPWQHMLFFERDDAPANKKRGG